jgi:arginyl-tRNA synthetase
MLPRNMLKFLEELSEQLAEQIPNDILTKAQIFGLLERPQREEHGDIAFPCFQLAKAQKKAPPMIATDLAKTLKLTENFLPATPLGPYLNFKLSPKACLEILVEVEKKKDQFGYSNKGGGKTILVEYSSPNVAKELHIGHFRNTILGQSLNNIYKAGGYKTISINHLGDWGSQFGRVAYGYQKWGNEEEMLKNPLEYLMKLYVRVNQEEEIHPEIDREARLIFKKIEEKDPELTKLWKQFCELSIEGLKRVYARLGVHFDHYIGESFYVDKIESLLKDLKAKKLLVESEGAQVVQLEEDAPPCILVTGDGTSLYATRDLAAAIWRYNNFHFDRALYVVGNEQQLHFKQIFHVLKMMNFSWADQLEHVNYGLYRFKDGKFSTRKGKVILAEEVMNEAKEKALEIIKAKNPSLPQMHRVAEQVGVGAVVYNDLSTDRAKDVEFDWATVLDFEGDTGPYLQYSYARACSILRSGLAAGFQPKLPTPEASFVHQDAALSLMKQFGRLELAIDGAVRLNKPSIVANYAMDLAKSFSSFYRQIRVLDEKATADETNQKLGLVLHFKQVLKNTLFLLCMQAPEEM